MKILHIDNIIGETSAPYNEHVLAQVDKYSFAVCTYFPSPISVPEPIQFYAGKGTLRSFFRQLHQCISENQFSIVHVHMPQVGALVVLFLIFMKPGLRRRSVYTVHNGYHSYSWLNLLLLVPVFLFFNRIIHCSNSSYSSFPLFYRILAGRGRVAVPNGVDVKRIDGYIAGLKENTDSSRKKDNDEFRILSIGRLVAIKNPLLLLDVIKRLDLPQVTLYLIGEGGLRAEIESTIKRENLSSRVILMGIITRERVYRELLSADLCISASFGEGLPVGLMEAMCCSCPVVISDIPSHRELAVDTSLVPLVAGNDSRMFANKIEEIVSLSATERANMGKKCKQLIDSRFSLEEMHRRYSAIYQQLA